MDWKISKDIHTTICGFVSADKPQTKSKRDWWDVTVGMGAKAVCRFTIVGCAIDFANTFVVADEPHKGPYTTPGPFQPRFTANRAFMDNDDHKRLVNQKTQQTAKIRLKQIFLFFDLEDCCFSINQRKKIFIH